MVLKGGREGEVGGLERLLQSLISEPQLVSLVKN